MALTLARAQSNEDAALLRLYVDRFNQRDWVALRELIAADARLLVADRYAGPLSAAPYFSTCERVAVPWRFAAGEIDCQPVVIILHETASGWVPDAAARLQIRTPIDRRQVPTSNPSAFTQTNS